MLKKAYKSFGDPIVSTPDGHGVQKATTIYAVCFKSDTSLRQRFFSHANNSPTAVSATQGGADPTPAEPSARSARQHAAVGREGRWRAFGELKAISERVTQPSQGSI